MGITCQRKEETHRFQTINSNNALFTYATTKCMRELISKASKVITTFATFNLSFHVSRVYGTKFSALLTFLVFIQII